MAFQTKHVMLLHAGYLLLFTQQLLCNTIDKSKFEITIGRPSDKPYDLHTQICCNGITQKKSDPQSACCGNQTYNPNKEVCCNGYTSSKTNEMRCCNKQLYNSKTHTCVPYVNQANINNDATLLSSYDNTFILIPIPEEDYFPCGDGVVNLKTSLCCGGIAISMSGIENPHCCGETVFDSKVDFCCFNRFGQDSLIVRPLGNDPENSETRCCNGHPFDSLRQVCAPSGQGTILDIPDKNHKWCVDQFIDTTEKICCSDKRIVTKEKRNHTKCCGNVSFSPYEESCCDDKLSNVSSAMKCCPGNGLYDPTIDTCCSFQDHVNSETKNKLSRNKLGPCCYLTAFDQTKESCCGISVVPKSPDGQSGCCEFNMNGAKATLDEIIAYKPPGNSLQSDLSKKLDDYRKSLAAGAHTTVSVDTTTRKNCSSQQEMSLLPWVFLLYILNFVNKNLF